MQFNPRMYTNVLLRQQAVFPQIRKAVCDVFSSLSYLFPQLQARIPVIRSQDGKA